MSIIRILQYPDNKLKQQTEPVKDIKDHRIQKIIDDMLETLAAQENCLALAACQLDIVNPPQVVVINTAQEPLCLINPQILHKQGEVYEEEACMSVYPGKISAKVKRAAEITYRALDRNGTLMEQTTNGLFARCIQHEIDHLYGILYIDHLSKLKRNLIDRKIMKIQKNER